MEKDEKGIEKWKKHHKWQIMVFFVLNNNC